jgi:polyhydroxybutyrate depolymerase
VNGRVSVLICFVTLAGCTGDGGGGAGAEGGTSAGDGASTDASGTGSTGEPTPDACIGEPSPGDHVYACSDQPCGLIVDVHGFTMSAQMQDANTNLRALGSERGYIVVQPNATPDPPSASWEPEVDDDKVFDFMMRVVDVFGVDENRIHFTGFSQGGWMSWRFACAHADVLASVAPAAACGDPECDFEAQVPARPLPILYMHGTDDALVAYTCAEPRRDAVVAAWGLGAETVVAEGAGYRWTRHEGEATLEFISHDYVVDDNTVLGGHCFPGSTDPGGAPGQLFPFGCSGASGFTWGEAVIDFFEAHPRP